MWPGQLNYSVETPDENIAMLNVKGFEYATSTVDNSEIFYTRDTSDVNYVFDKLQTGDMQEFLWEQTQDLLADIRDDFSYFFLPNIELRHFHIDYDAAKKELESLNIKHNVPLYLKRINVLKQIESKAIPNGGSQNETLAHTVARQKQLEDILSFAIPENANDIVELFCVYAGEDRVEEKDAKNILQWYYDTISKSVTPNTKEEKMMLIPTIVQNIPTDKGVLRLRALHNTVDRLRYLDPKNEYVLAAHAALEDLESIANAKGADLVNDDDDAKDAARTIWANTILYLRDVYHKRSEVDQTRPFWNSYMPESDSGLVKFFQTKAESGEGSETLRYKFCANAAKDLQKTYDDFPYGELATALTFRQVSETSPEAVAKIAKTYERAKEKFMKRYPGDKPDIFAISASKDYSNIIVGDGRNYVSLPVKDVKTAKAIAAILPYYSGAKHVEGAPDLGQYFSNPRVATNRKV
jgi:hypothetical protein